MTFWEFLSYHLPEVENIGLHVLGVLTIVGVYTVVYERCRKRKNTCNNCN